MLLALSLPPGQLTLPVQHLRPGLDRPRTDAQRPPVTQRLGRQPIPLGDLTGRPQLRLQRAYAGHRPPPSGVVLRGPYDTPALANVFGGHKGDTTTGPPAPRSGPAGTAKPQARGPKNGQNRRSEPGFDTIVSYSTVTGSDLRF